REQRGRPHLDESDEQIVAENLVVLITPYEPSPADPSSPEAQTVGDGDALVFTDGTVIRGHWERPNVDEPAALTGPDGDELKLTPGRTWVELPREGETTVD